MKHLILAVLALVSACTTPGTLTAGQSLYAALGSYGIAVAAAKDYALSPTANKAVVVRLNDLNQAPATKAVVAYAHAYVDCAGRNDTASTCLSLDFTPETVARNAVALRGVIAQLGAR